MRFVTLGLASLVLDDLKRRGHSVYVAEDLEDLSSLAQHFAEGASDSFEAVVFGVDGVEHAGPYAPRFIRKRGSKMPIIGVRSDPIELRNPEERALFLEQGGDDLLYEPVNFRELEASISAVVRRTAGHVIDIKYLMNDRIKLNVADRVVSIDGKRVHLSAQLFDVVANLARNLRRVVTKENFMHDLYGGMDDDAADIKIIDVLICKIRAAFEEVAEGTGKCIQTVWGSGYMLDEPPGSQVETVRTAAS